MKNASYALIDADRSAPFVVQVDLLNDEGDRTEAYGWGESVDEAIANAEHLVRTEDDYTWVMTDWAAAPTFFACVPDESAGLAS